MQKVKKVETCKKLPPKNKKQRLRRGRTSSPLLAISGSQPPPPRQHSNLIEVDFFTQSCPAYTTFRLAWVSMGEKIRSKICSSA